MTAPVVPLPLSDEEARIIAALREVPEAGLGRLVRDLIRALTEFARDPHCNETQGDGVPCAAAGNRCDECSRVLDILRHFELRVQRPPRLSPDASDPAVELEAW